MFYDARYSHTRMTNPDFLMLARAMGVHAIRCHNAEELPAKMKEFLEYDGSKPVLMECLVERNEHVFPMVCSRYFACFVKKVLIFVSRYLPERHFMNRSCTRLCNGRKSKIIIVLRPSSRFSSLGNAWKCLSSMEFSGYTCIT